VLASSPFYSHTLSKGWWTESESKIKREREDAADGMSKAAAIGLLY